MKLAVNGADQIRFILGFCIAFLQLMILSLAYDYQDEKNNMGMRAIFYLSLINIFIGSLL